MNFKETERSARKMQEGSSGWWQIRNKGKITMNNNRPEPYVEKSEYMIVEITIKSFIITFS